MSLLPIVSGAAGGGSLLSGLLGAGSKLLGGLFGGGKQKKDLGFLRDLRHSAESAGINVLEALRATGGQIPMQGMRTPLASQAFIQDGLSDVSDILTGRAEQERVAREAEIELTRAQTRAVLRGLSGQERVGRTVFRSGSTVAVSRPSTRQDPVTGGLIVGAPYVRGEPAFDRTGQPLTPALSVGAAGTYRTNPNVSDAELAEQRYGEVGSNVYGLGVAIADGAYNTGRAVEAGYNWLDTALENDWQNYGRPAMDRVSAILVNPETYEKPVSRKEPKPGWMEDSFGKGHLAEE